MATGIGARIVEARERAGIASTAELARQIAALLKRWGFRGISRAAVAQWESGNTKNLRPENLIAVADITRVTVRWLALGPNIRGRGPDENVVHLSARESSARYPAKHDTIELATKIEQLPPEARKIVVQFVRSQKTKD